MNYIKKIASYFNKNKKSVEEDIVEINIVDTDEEIDIDYPSVIVRTENNTTKDFKSLLDFINEEELEMIARTVKEKSNVKSKYISGDLKDLFKIEEV